MHLTDDVCKDIQSGYFVYFAKGSLGRIEMVGVNIPPKSQKLSDLVYTMVL